MRIDNIVTDPKCLSCVYYFINYTDFPIFCYGKLMKEKKECEYYQEFKKGE